MKKMIALMLGTCMLSACCLAGCGGGGDDKKDPPETDTGSGETIVTDAASIDFAFDGLYQSGELKDAASGFAAREDVTGARFFVNGQYEPTISAVSSRQDVKFEFFNGTKTRIANISAGMAFTIPAAEIKADYLIAKYHTKYTFGDSILTFSAESSNPYTNDQNGWFVYMSEWLIDHFINGDVDEDGVPVYFKNQNLTLLKGLAEPFTKEHQLGDTTLKPGFDSYRFDVLINDNENIERPYYNIGIIREAGQMKTFALFVMKSKTNHSEDMDNILKSFNLFTSKGLQRNYFDGGKPKADPHWNAETLAYFNQFCNQTTKSWGVFSYSMPGNYNALEPGQPGYDGMLRNSKTIQKEIEDNIWHRKYDIYMTYTHIGSGKNAADLISNNTFHYFPLNMAKELAGGNGDGTRQTMEFTFQFTTNNNLVDEQLTPMFDILRGKYDDYFKQLALDIKAYAKPIMFRLNNEMNSDWTSYCGMMTLLDPDIFNMTWIRLYNIFIENGVDNVIWVWNPIADSCPYSSWGEDLCYFPGLDYVQLLGGTCYEFCNDVSKMKTFKQYYSGLYEKNKPYFDEWSMIIGEFACGSGGAIDSSGTKTEIGRNRDVQAKWIKEMFEELYADNPEPYANQIKGLIWFNTNDYSNGLVMNRLKFTDAGLSGNESYTDLTGTWDAWRQGFELEKSKQGK